MPADFGLYGGFYNARQMEWEHANRLRAHYKNLRGIKGVIRIPGGPAGKRNRRGEATKAPPTRKKVEIAKEEKKR